MALTTLTRLKAIIGIKDSDLTQDDKLQFYLDAASETIEGLTGRGFELKTYTETVSGTGSRTLIPMHYPVVSVQTLYASGERIFNPFSLLNFGDYGISESGSEIVSYIGGFYRGTNNIQYTYQAGYAVIPADIQMATAWCAQWYYNVDTRKDLGRSSKSKGDESTSISESLPQIVRDVIQRYKRYEIPNVYQSVVVG